MRYVFALVVLSGCATTLPPTDKLIKTGLDVLQCVEPAIVELQKAREADALKVVTDAAASGAAAK